MNKVRVEMIERWTGVTFDWKPGEIIDMNPGDAERLIAGGVCKPVATTPAKPQRTKKEQE